MMTQIVFRGYVKKKDVLIYEFFHEQIWVLVEPSVNKTHHVSVDVWLPRFPPSITLADGSEIEYAVRATIKPWHANEYQETIFQVKRSLILKMPHRACCPLTHKVDKCVGHNSWIHKTCNPINGKVNLEKQAFSPNEDINISWELQNDLAQIEHVHCKLHQVIQLRRSDPGHFMYMKSFRKQLSDHKSTSSNATITVPSDCLVSMPMTLWNVLIVKYEVVLEVKIQKTKAPLALKYPVIISSEVVQVRRGSVQINNLFQRVQDIDDDTDDDDDYDSESDDDDEEDAIRREQKDFSIDLEKIEIKTQESKTRTLENSCADVKFTVNSQKPEVLHSLRLLLMGEARVGAIWYEFLRFKAIAKSDTTSKLSPGIHTLRFNLPFGESQYDVNILPPSMAEDIRYIVRGTSETLRKNVFPVECDVFVDRFVDTWAKESYKAEHVEEYGATKLYMSQRCFQRGKVIVVRITGNGVQKVNGKLIQQQRMRIPGLKEDDSYISERCVSSRTDRNTQHRQIHILEIPEEIPPSIEISYWNVVQIAYHYETNITLEDGHTHSHRIPVWIGCTEDNVVIPDEPLLPPKDETVTVEPKEEELPEFEVVLEGDTHYHPYWVERFNGDAYQIPYNEQ
ncbi:unnamed protein product [Caenorhabditis bovis]|uniref:Arrestin C-terminal-like domain-containing protein n=1 Tax=Caenorhabditis bovis TaxID=2654633 RepID=A0A8S1EJR7_9PELO|nr:unnamed protein product [Caenorhabditis bovis]